MTESTNSTERSTSIRERWAPLSLVFVGGFWNFFMMPTQEYVFTDWWMFYLFFLAVGTMVMQQALAALWGAWSTQPAVSRFPIGIAVSVFLSLTMISDGQSLVTVLMLLGIHLLLLAVLCLLRWRLSYVMTTQKHAQHDKQKSTAFDLKYLFLWTTVAALLVMFGRLVTYGEQIWGSSVGQFFGWVVGASVLLLPSLWLTVSLMSPIRPSMLHMLILLFATPLAAFLPAGIQYWEYPSVFSFWEDSYKPAFCMGMGAFAAAGLTAIVLRWAGYRIYPVGKT